MAEVLCQALHVLFLAWSNNFIYLLLLDIILLKDNVLLHKYMNEDKSNKSTKQLSNQFIFLLGSLGIGTAKD